MGSSGEPAKECEGCGEKVAILLETDDSVLLCKPCLDSSAEDFSAKNERSAALEAQNRQLREALTELLFWIYPTEGEDLRKHDQFTDCAIDCYRLVGHDRAPEFFRAALAATEEK